MDIKVLGITFVSILAAELADKTQLIGLTLSAKSGKPVSVWIGSVLGYMMITLLTVIIGVTLCRFIREDLIRYAGAVLFFLAGFFMLIGKI